MFKMAWDVNFIHKGATMRFYLYFMEKSEAAALAARLSLKLKLSDHSVKGKLKAY